MLIYYEKYLRVNNEKIKALEMVYLLFSYYPWNTKYMLIILIGCTRVVMIVSQNNWEQFYRFK